MAKNALLSHKIVLEPFPPNSPPKVIFFFFLPETDQIRFTQRSLELGESFAKGTSQDIRYRVYIMAKMIPIILKTTNFRLLALISYIALLNEPAKSATVTAKINKSCLHQRGGSCQKVSATEKQKRTTTFLLFYPPPFLHKEGVGKGSSASPPSSFRRLPQRN
ncbi:hypothetical protein NPIL_608291 [Nephila pilipes]|uniref:Uncharacterized protein n=1 Tax=Nephila pilipes TaxID=299642 RepID=A0A8X6MWA2_NEPPI|nr:hypothetical protein NPIL_608291 [Nephila pilipes]